MIRTSGSIAREKHPRASTKALDVLDWAMKFSSLTPESKIATVEVTGKVKNEVIKMGRKNFDQNRKLHAKSSKPIHFHIPVIKTLVDPIQW